jgi:hypothetical protein
MCEVLTHLWQEQGLGQAPFHAVCIISLPSKSLCEHNPEAYNRAMAECGQMARGFGVHLCTCESCGMSLTNNVVIRDANRKHFVVGCDCAGKTNDTKLTTKVALLEKARLRKIKEDRQAAERIAREARIAADLASQRERNNGLTDAEVAAQTARIEAERVAEHFTAENGWLISVLRGMSGDFVQSMARQLERAAFSELSDRCQSILCEIYSKSVGGRMNSKAYAAAESDFNSKTGRSA